MQGKVRIITAPDDRTLELLKRRTGPDGKIILSGPRPGAIALFEAKLPDLYYLADVAMKAHNVTALEVTGGCPQHISTIALVGDTADVRQAAKLVKEACSGGDGL